MCKFMYKHLKNIWRIMGFIKIFWKFQIVIKPGLTRSHFVPTVCVYGQMTFSKQPWIRIFCRV
jgi:hypothetical protein